MNKSVLVFAGALVSATAIHAKTVLWYHFDEAEPGTRTTASSVIVDSAGAQNGAPEYWWNDGKATNDNWMPAYTNAFPNGCVWFDPVSGQRGSLNRCLHIVNPPVYGEWGNGAHGVVRIPDNEKFHLQTFTIEMFVKDLYLSDPEHSEVRSRSSNHYVFCKANSWGLSINGGNGNGSDAVTKFIWRDDNGAAVSWSDGVNANMYPRTQRDGNWHHVALVVDGADQSAVKVEVYVDYVKQYNSSKTMPGPIHYDNSDIWIGRYPLSGLNGWGGLIDEFRISDKVLSPDEMLRFVNPRTDADTLLYLSFDNWMGDLFKLNPCGSAPNNYLVNESGNVEAARPILTLRANTNVPEYVKDTVGLLRRDIAAEAAYADAGCLHPLPNSAHQTLGITYPLTGSRIVTKDDFTIEMFVKCPELPTVYEYVMRNYTTFAATGKSYSWYIQVNESGTVSLMSNWTKGATTTQAVLADGGWHHLAWVTEKATQTSRLYVDYVQIGEITDAELCPIAPADATDAGELIFGSYAENGQNGNSFTGLIDDIRVTGRALVPQEFLTTRLATGAVAASVSFENDLSENPAEYADLFGLGKLTGFGRYAGTRPFRTEANRKSMRLDGATVDFGRNIFLERQGAFTLEFFLRPEALYGQSNVISLKKPAPSDESVWSVSLSEDKSTLVVGVGADSVSFPLPAIADWWHHYGLVFTESAGLPVVTLYVDHVQVGEPKALATALDYPAYSSGLVVGSESFIGWVDEIRVTKGVLAVEDMMECGPYSGILLHIK